MKYSSTKVKIHASDWFGTGRVVCGSCKMRHKRLIITVIGKSEHSRGTENMRKKAVCVAGGREDGH